MPGNGAYCASKAGLIAYLQSLRAELRPTALRVHTISPGYLRTPLTAGNRFAMPGLLEADEAARRLLAGVAAGTEHIVLPGASVGFRTRWTCCPRACTTASCSASRASRARANPARPTFQA